MRLYTSTGRRRIAPPLVFGAGVLFHLLRRGRRYDAVHTASFPYFSVLAAALARRRGRYALVVDWHELWSSAYWREYLGGAGGRLGERVQRLCMRVPQRAHCFSRLTEGRLREGGLRGEVTMLEGEYAGDARAADGTEREPLVVFAGRHVPDKGVADLVPALAVAMREAPELHGLILGDGPERTRVLRAVAAAGLADRVRVPGIVPSDEVAAALARALCLVLPSRREGYGLVVVEASAHGTPSVVVAGPDNAAVEMVEEMVNGTVAPSASPADLAAAILRVREGGAGLRSSTAAWFANNAKRLSLDSSLAVVSAAYRSD